MIGTLYYVDVTTGSETKSGTQSRVFLKLIGETGEHGEVELGTKFKKGRFVGKCAIWYFPFKNPLINDL